MWRRGVIRLSHLGRCWAHRRAGRPACLRACCRASEMLTLLSRVCRAGGCLRRLGRRPPRVFGGRDTTTTIVGCRAGHQGGAAEVAGGGASRCGRRRLALLGRSFSAPCCGCERPPWLRCFRGSDCWLARGAPTPSLGLGHARGMHTPSPCTRTAAPPPFGARFHRPLNRQEAPRGDRDLWSVLVPNGPQEQRPPLVMPPSSSSCCEGAAALSSGVSIRAAPAPILLAC